MKGIRIWPFVFLLCLALVLGACAPGDGPAGLQQVQPEEAATAEVKEAGTDAPIEVIPTGTADPKSPEGVALSFFTAYTEANRTRTLTLGNPEFEAQKHLSEEYLRQVAEIQAGFEGFGFDPVLQAQDVPPEPIEVKETQVEGDKATVTLQFGRTVLEQPWERSVSLEKINDEWKIVPDRVEGGGLDPEATAQAFYDWYLAYTGSGEDFRNPLADRAYRAAPYLTMEMIHKVDSMAESGFFYDPFLCAQDIPSGIKPLASFYNGARPTVVMGSDFSDHYIVADLARVNFNQWAIRNITCGVSPEGFAKAFYTWALDYAIGGGEMHNPLLDGAYQASGFLSQGFVAELSSMMASTEPLMADPIFLAQDFPQAFNVEPCPERDCALVNMQYGDTMIHQLKVDLVEENGHLRIAGVSNPGRLENEQPEPDIVGVEYWAPFTDEAYGYGFRFPSGWQVKTTPVTDLHTPEEYRVMRSVRLTAPVGEGEVLSFSAEVIVGDEETISASFPADQKVEEMQINGYPVSVYRSEPGLITYVFRHPAKENVWLVFTDAITQFPGREALAQAAGNAFEAILSTVVFSR